MHSTKGSQRLRRHYFAGALMFKDRKLKGARTEKDLTEDLQFYDICSCTLKLTTPTFRDFNHFVSALMSRVKTCIRFPSQFNFDLRKLPVHLFSFPRLHFFIRASRLSHLTVPNNTAHVLRRNSHSRCSSPRTRCVLPIRGTAVKRLWRCFVAACPTKEVDEQVLNVQNKISSYFVERIPNNIKDGVSDIPPKGLKMAVAFFGNTIAIQKLFKTVVEFPYDDASKLFTYIVERVSVLWHSSGRYDWGCRWERHSARFLTQRVFDFRWFVL